MKLLVAGTGHDGEALKDLFIKKGVWDLVEWLGRVPLCDMMSIYHQAHVFLLPSRFEGCGFSLIEAMACGCVPVVSNIRGSLDRIVNDQSCGMLARVGDVDHFARCIEDLTQDQDLVRCYSEAARCKVVANYVNIDWGIKYATFIKSKMGSSRSQPLPISDFNLSNGASFSRLFRRYIPQVVKNVIRKYMERHGRFV